MPPRLRPLGTRRRACAPYLVTHTATCWWPSSLFGRPKFSCGSFRSAPAGGTGGDRLRSGRCSLPRRAAAGRALSGTGLPSGTPDASRAGAYMDDHPFLDGVRRVADVPGGVLVGHDGSVCAQEALRWAAALALRAGYDLHVVRIWDLTSRPRPSTRS